MVAFAGDRLGVPQSGAAQPISQTVLNEARRLGLSQDGEPAPYPMTLSAPATPADDSGFPVRVAGVDMGPRCWFWRDELINPSTSACVWAELMASGTVTTRLPLKTYARLAQLVLAAARAPTPEPSRAWRASATAQTEDFCLTPPAQRRRIFPVQFSGPLVDYRHDGPYPR